MIVIPGRPGRSALAWFIQCTAETQIRLALRDGSGLPVTNAVRLLGLPRTPAAGTRVKTLLAIAQDLEPDKVYSLIAEGDDFPKKVPSRTLPEQFSDDTKFTVALGSCYCLATDPYSGIDGALYRYYPPPLEDPIRFRINCGDQIYMDLPKLGFGWAAVPLGFGEVWEKYESQWSGHNFQSFFRLSPNVALCDDHEFWNDYPNQQPHMLWTSTPYAARLDDELDAAFSVYQASLNLDPQTQTGASIPREKLVDEARTFEMRVDGDQGLSFFFLDTRSNREPVTKAGTHQYGQFTKVDWLKRALKWIKELKAPGVMVLSQPFAEPSGTGFDMMLANCPAQFSKLRDALFAAPHDVVVASGDVHYSRQLVLTDPATNGNRRVVEVVSSPYCRIPDPMLGGDGGSFFRKIHNKVHDWLGKNLLVQTQYVDEGRQITYTTLTFQKDGNGGYSMKTNVWVRADNGVKSFESCVVNLS